MQPVLQFFNLGLLFLDLSIPQFGNLSVVSFTLGLFCLELGILYVDLVLLNTVDQLLLRLPPVSYTHLKWPV